MHFYLSMQEALDFFVRMHIIKAIRASLTNNGLFQI